MKLSEILETYSAEGDLEAAIDRELPDLENVGFIDGHIYVHDETTIGDVPVYWEWSEKDGYIVHHDTDGKDLSSNIQRIVTQKIKEMDPVHKSGKYDEEIEQIEELRKSYNEFRRKQDYEDERGDYEYQRRKDAAAERR